MLIKIEIKIIIVLLLISQSALSQVFQEECNPKNFQVDTFGQEINWEQFPDFKLPFTVVYHGKITYDSLLHQFDKGFSHIAGPTKAYKDTVFPEQRVYTWTGIAKADGWAEENNQPWFLIKSPWNNDIEGYKQKWMDRFNYISENWYKYNPQEGPKFDIVIADLEWAIHKNNEILSLKKYKNLIPTNYHKTSDEIFLRSYKNDMTKLYGQTLQFVADSLNNEIILSSYNETPIRRNWHLIDDYTWEEWSSDSSLVDYLMHSKKGFMNSIFYKKHNIIAPSIYNFYNVDSSFSGRKYLAYNLFTIEANQAWSQKEQLVYVWLNYHPYSSNLEPIKPWMAEATAIFPFMAGVKGVYPWLPESYKTYEYFIYGLYRLSKHSHMFNGKETYIKPEPAYNSFINETPIWRGVVNNNKILIAAQNPFANAFDTTLISVVYKNSYKTIGLLGNETFLCEFNINDFKKIDNSISLIPNPAKNLILIEGIHKNCNLSIFDINGKIVIQEKAVNIPMYIDISYLKTGTYILKIDNPDFKKTIIKKFIKK